MICCRSPLSSLKFCPVTETFKKLNFKSQSPILIFRPAESFAAEVSAMKGVTEIHLIPKKDVKYPFVIAFVEMHAEMEKTAHKVVRLLAEDDPVCWFAYPKGTSKIYKSDLSRDVLRASLLEMGLNAVRQIAIDDDWSALRFRAGKSS
jgi:hypothetical protein